MKTTAALLLAAGTCGAGFLASWLIFRGDGACKVELPPTQPARIDLPTEARAAAPVQELEKPDSRLVVASPESPPPEPATQPQQTAPPPSEFAAVLSMPEATRAEKEAKEHAIRVALDEKTRPILQKRFEAGFGEFLHDEQTYSGLPDDEGLIYAVEMPAGGHGTYRTALPRDEDSTFYEVHDVANRLKKEAWALELQEAKTAKSQPADPTPR